MLPLRLKDDDISLFYNFTSIGITHRENPLIAFKAIRPDTCSQTIVNFFRMDAKPDFPISPKDPKELVAGLKASMAGLNK